MYVFACTRVGKEYKNFSFFHTTLLIKFIGHHKRHRSSLKANKSYFKAPNVLSEITTFKKISQVRLALLNLEKKAKIYL